MIRVLPGTNCLLARSYSSALALGGKRRSCCVQASACFRWILSAHHRFLLIFWCRAAFVCLMFVNVRRSVCCLRCNRCFVCFAVFIDLSFAYAFFIWPSALFSWTHTEVLVSQGLLHIFVWYQQPEPVDSSLLVVVALEDRSHRSLRPSLHGHYCGFFCAYYLSFCPQMKLPLFFEAGNKVLICCCAHVELSFSYELFAFFLVSHAPHARCSMSFSCSLKTFFLV